MRTTVLVLNIFGLNCISRFITGHIGTGVLVLLIDIFSILLISNVIGWILLGIGGIIYIVDLITVCTGNWEYKGKYLNDWRDGSRTNGTHIQKSNNNVNLAQNNGIQVSGKNWRDILIDNNLAEYIEIFEKNKLTDLLIISELNEMDLEKLGIDIMGDRKRMLKIFAEINNTNLKQPEFRQEQTPHTIDSSYIIKQEMSLYQEQYDYNNVLERLMPGDKVEFIKSGGIVSVAGQDAPMFNVKTRNGHIGWCFSGFLDKLVTP
jgi:hypothetical protein